MAWERGRAGGCPFTEAAYELDDRPGPVRDAVAAAQAEWIAALSRAAEIAIEEGHFLEDIEPRALRSLLQSFHDPLGMASALEGWSLHGEEVRADLEYGRD